MRITYIHQHFRRPDESGGTRSYELARRLARDGHVVTMISSGDIASRYDVAGFQVVQLPVRYDNAMSVPHRICAFALFMARATVAAVRVRADVVLATSTPLTVAIPGVIAARIRRARFVLEVRDLWPTVPIAVGALTSRPAIWLARCLERFAYASADQIVALSPGMADGVRKVNPGVSVSTVPNASDVELFRIPEVVRQDIRRELGWLPDDTVLVYAGSFGRTYGVAWAVRLAAELADPKIRIVLIGSGATLEADRALARSLGLPDRRVRHTGALSKVETARYVAAADVALSCLTPEPALRSLSLNKVFDAFAAGRPVLTNHDGWLSDLLVEAGAGWATSGADIRRAADLVRALHFDPSRVKVAASASAELGGKRFDRDHLYDKFLASVVPQRGDALRLAGWSTSR
jgi:glycosyltransferase involved in cell wall biosynthesis